METNAFVIKKNINEKWFKRLLFESEKRCKKVYENTKVDKESLTMKFD